MILLCAAQLGGGPSGWRTATASNAMAPRAFCCPALADALFAGTRAEEVLLLGLKDEGYTSFWNDSISYGLRGCILAELMLRGRVRCVKAKLPLEEKKLEVIDTTKTGDRILDEVLEVMATSASRAHSCGYWVDGACFRSPAAAAACWLGEGVSASGGLNAVLCVLSASAVLSGESWNVMKLKFSIKNLRERLAKGLVDKGVLGTESQSFGLFEMATHPLKDASVKEEVVFRVQVSQRIHPPTLSTEREAAHSGLSVKQRC